MSQNSTIINDGTGAQVLQAINDAFDTVVSLHSGTAAPGNPQAGMLWLDTSSNRLKIRNSANSAWTDIGSVDESGLHSAAELLDKIKTVDGAGSGLDADLVRGLPADFTSSKVSSGYQKLPSGLIIQWVTGVAQGATEASQTITFPITFPNAPLQILVSTNAADVGSDGTYQFLSYTNSSVVVFPNKIDAGTSPRAPAIFAIGY